MTKAQGKQRNKNSNYYKLRFEVVKARKARNATKRKMQIELRQESGKLSIVDRMKVRRPDVKVARRKRKSNRAVKNLNPLENLATIL